MTILMSYDDRRDMIVTHAWEIWTNNGLGMNSDDWQQTEKTVQDAVNNVYYQDITDEAWLDATLNALGR